MNLSLIQKSTKDLSRSLSKNSPTILTGLGVAGLLTSIIMAVKGANRAQEILWREADFRRNDWSRQTGESEESYPIDPILTTEEIIELTWKCYIPTAVMGLTTIACMIGANSIHLRRNAALVSLFSITETALKEYQAKVVETIGENKEEKLRGDIAQDKIEKNPPEKNAVIVTHNGSMLCYDSLSGRYFFNDVENIRRVQNDFNKRLMSEMSISLNEFYDDIGLEPIDMGAQTGWTIERGMMNIFFAAKLTKDNQPCIVLEHKTLPTNIWG